MTPPGILMLTLLVVVLVLALALLAGSLALLVNAGDPENAHHSGVRQALSELDRQWRIERWAYRHHRAFGLLIIVAGLVCIWQLVRLDLSAAADPRILLAWLLLGGQALNLAIGILIFTRPSLLKPLEALGNRWHEFDVPRRLPPRLKATLLCLVAAMVAATSGLLLIRALGYLGF